ncbi:tripartite tricarboxylate transporter TctB family protein [Natronolimnohabitans innermongolicus]|uniref:DUF1468 domain-containing protein n=1 Tax=Natronolimnohabitans innermongolicus JCM 12255 TaxID=1227499 RepID=L9XEG8_9EURY|nr:tripartite tricarboxylate transporter TctB family protein [Natronolimnohabitans innermongolicus]ELY59023.1 hypothetical protein C493_05215 [Natronolimnohabitans innermongolicus JCM 12255]
MIKKFTRSVRQLNVDNITSNPLAAVFILLSFATIYYASQFPSGEGLGAGFFPIVISLTIIVFAVADIIVDDDTELDVSDFELTPAVIVTGLLLAYLAVMPYTGFLVGSMLFLPPIMYYSDVRSKPLIATVSLLLPIVLFYIFSRIFMVRLPEGIIPISRLLPELPLMVI